MPGLHCFYIGLFLLFDAPSVEGFRVFGGVGQMFAVGACKVVRTGKVLFGAHIQVVVLDMVQHGVDTGDGRVGCVFVMRYLLAFRFGYATFRFAYYA